VGDPTTGEPLILLGEVRTCLLPDSRCLDSGSVRDLLAVMPGRPVTWRERPVGFAASPATAVGVDCALATASTTAVRAIGTVATRAIVLGGRVLQSSARTDVDVALDTHRQAWSHYLSRLGVVEVVSRIKNRPALVADLSAGFLGDRSAADILDLAAISERMLARLRMNVRLDQRPPILAATTRLRWTAEVADVPRPRASVELGEGRRRSVRLWLPEPALLGSAQRFCEDLAAHDWLLTTVGAAIAEADQLSDDESLDVLAPLLEHLVHLWMPSAHAPEALRHLWADLEDDPGFTRQWTALVGLLRDRIAVATLAALRRSRINTTDW
jgi:hypothetical protein